MSKLAIVFPGQGAQSIGMGQDLFEHYDEAKIIFEKATQAIGYNISKMCFEGPEEALRITENTQPTILTTSMAIYEVLKAKGVVPDVVAGLSLGEFSALVASGVMTLEEAVVLVKKRGKFMQEEVADGIGGMAAILGLEDHIVEDVCTQIHATGIVEPANYNCPKQLVIAGELKAVEEAIIQLKALGAKKALMLPVSAPFHTSMLKGAGEKLKIELEKCNINQLNIPVVSNVDATYYKDKSEVISRLIRQVSKPVRWSQSVKNMIESGVDIFIEIGPGNTLSKFIKRINKSVTILNVSDSESLEKTLDILKERGYYDKLKR